MRSGCTCGFLFALAVGLAAVSTPALAQLTDADIAELQARGQREGWTFSVGRNEVTDYPLWQLCGMVEPEGWWETAEFAEIVPERALPASFDWRNYSACTPIRNQGGCGSCWAFGTVAPLESAVLMYEGISTDLSEQWLVSCNSDGWSCSGGWWAHDYHKNKTDPCGGSGAVHEVDFPYVQSNAPCNCPYPHVYWINNWAFISGYNIPSVDAIKQAMLDYGPIAVCVTADAAFQGYKQGIFNACTTSPINHAVALVGWNDADGGYWILRNSWGIGWGEGGYMRIRYNCSNVGYAATYIKYKQYLISGTITDSGGAPLAGVRLNGLPRSPVTFSHGYYSALVPAGWSGTSTPYLPGWGFTPTSRTYSNVQSNKTNQNFTAAPLPNLISGYVRKAGGEPVAGVTLVGLPGDPVTDPNGYYWMRVENGWSGTVTPVRAGFEFQPTSRIYTNVQGNVPGQDYTAVPLPFMVSGHIRYGGGEGIPDVVLSGLPGNPTTGPDGYYSGIVDGGWSGLVTPTRPGHTFVPAGRYYSDVTTNQVNQDYTGTIMTLLIRGYVRTSQGEPLEGVRIKGLPGNPKTLSDGRYFSWVTYGWSGSATPELDCYAFDPPTRTYLSVTQTMDNEDYTASLTSVTLAGHVRNQFGVGVSDVTLVGLPGNPVTDDSGFYSALVTCSEWGGTVIPTEPEYTFQPPHKEYYGLTANLLTEDYLATPKVDCNNNGVADSRDIANGTSFDDNANGVPDECEKTLGDLNCDSVVDFGDIGPFVVAVGGHGQYQAAYPGCIWLNGDFTGDGAVTFDDITPFVNALSNP